MKLIVVILGFFLSVHAAEAQQIFRMEIDENQQMETLHGAPGLQIDLPVRQATVILGGQFDKEGLGQHVIYNGGRLLIDNMVIGPGGQRYVTLRREDGRNFYDMFPLLKAKLIPIVELKPDSDKSEQ